MTGSGSEPVWNTEALRCSWSAVMNLEKVQTQTVATGCWVPKVLWCTRPMKAFLSASDGQKGYCGASWRKCQSHLCVKTQCRAVRCMLSCWAAHWTLEQVMVPGRTVKRRQADEENTTLLVMGNQRLKGPPHLPISQNPSSAVLYLAVKRLVRNK